MVSSLYYNGKNMKKTFKFNNFKITSDQEVSIHISSFGDLEVIQEDLVAGSLKWPTPTNLKSLGTAIGGFEHGDVSAAVNKENFSKGQTRLVMAHSENAIRSAGYRYNFKFKISKVTDGQYSVTRVK